MMTGSILSLPPHVVSKIHTEPNTGCWLWNASTYINGYGTLHYRGHNQVAHRVVYQMLVGEIPAGLDLDHLCRVRCCVNPDHLEPVTRRENIMRGEGIAAKWASRTHCKNGHAFDGLNSHGVRWCKTCDRERGRRRYAGGYRSPSWMKIRPGHKPQ